jgi:diacylglycerol kinase family enzyme
MKAITTEQIRLMKAQYKFDDDLVRVLDEVLEYREAEEESANSGDGPMAQGDGDPRSRTPLEIECGPSEINMMMNHVDRKVQ